MVDIFGNKLKDISTVLEKKNKEVTFLNAKIKLLALENKSHKDELDKQTYENSTNFKNLLGTKSSARELEDKVTVLELSLELEKESYDNLLSLKNSLENLSKENKETIELLDSKHQKLELDLASLKPAHEKQARENKINYANLLKERDKVANLKKELEKQQEDFEGQLSKIQSSALEEKNSDKSWQQKLESEIADLKEVLNEVEVSTASQEHEIQLLLDALTASGKAIDFAHSGSKSQKKDQLAFQEKLMRLHSAHPELVDYSTVEIISLDATHSPPLMVWKVSDYSSKEAYFPELFFVTTIKEGLPGLALIKSAQDRPSAEQFFIPKIFISSLEQRMVFRTWSASEWQIAQASIRILEDVIKNKGTNVRSGASFDYVFWESSLTSLVADFKKLPNILRFSSVWLKRELVNLDYEHLWLVINDLHYADHLVPKFEIRIAAANVQKDQFSQFPKLEFPLIDGKSKPFQSWFGESKDDFGEKFELRFALAEKKFDIGTFSKLSSADQLLMYQVVISLPEIFNALVVQKIALHRPLQDWQLFITKLVELFGTSIQAPAVQKMMGRRNSDIPFAALKSDGGDKGIPSTTIANEIPNGSKKPGISVSVIKKLNTKKSKAS